MKKQSKTTKRSIMPTVGDASGSALARVIGVQVVRRETLDDAMDGLAEAVENDAAQVVAKHLDARARILASTQALTAKVQEVLA